MTEVYRYVAAQAGSANAKPVVMLKSRQIGATILAAVLSLYFTSSGIYGGDRPPMRILHAFPTLGLMGLYAKDKLDPMIRSSQNGFLLSRSLRNEKNIGTNIPEDTQTEKNFIGFNKVILDARDHHKDDSVVKSLIPYNGEPQPIGHGLDENDQKMQGLSGSSVYTK